MVFQSQIAVGLDDIAGIGQATEGAPVGHRLLDFIDDFGIAQGRGIAERLVEEDRTQSAPHVLAGAGLGEGRNHEEIRGYGGHALLASDQTLQPRQVLVLQLVPGCRDDECHRRLALLIMRRADDHRIAERRVGPEHLVAQDRALDFLGADAVARDVDDIVGASVQGKGTVGMGAGIVALGVGQAVGPAVEVDGAEALEVTAPFGRTQALGVAPDGARQIGIGLLDDQLALLAFLGLAPADRPARLVGFFGNPYLGVDPRQGPGLGIGGQGFETAPGAGKHDPAVLCGPIGIDVVPADPVHGELLDGGRDRLGAEGRGLQRRHVEGGHVFGAGRVGHHRFQKGRAGLEHRRALALDDRGKTPGVRKQGRALVHDRGDAERQRRGDQIALAGDPAGIGDHIQTILGRGAEDRAHRMGDAGQPAAVGMHHALGLARRARGVDDEQRPVGGHGERRMAGAQGAPEVGIIQGQQSVQVVDGKARPARALEHPRRRRLEQPMRPVIAGLFDHLLTRVAHDDDFLDRVADLGQSPGHGGAHRSGTVRGKVTVLGQGVTELAHHIAALDRDLAGQSVFDGALECGGKFAQVELAQHLVECCQGRLQRDEIVQGRVRVSGLVGHDLGVSVAAVCGHHDPSARIVDPVRQGLGREAAEDRGVDQPEALGGLRVVELFGDIRQIEGDAVAALQAKTAEHLGA